MMLQSQLKESTAGLHAELEKIMFVDKIKDGSLAFADYQNMLRTNYVLHRKYESFLFDGLSTAISTQLKTDKRRKVSALEKDLLQAGMTIPKKDDDMETAIKLENNGAMYVFEGAMLGGNVIVKFLRVNPQMQAHRLSYFYYSLYAGNLTEYWKTFCDVINQQQTSAMPTILAAAEFIFKDFIKSAKNAEVNVAI